VSAERVALICGGASFEREVSLRGAHRVQHALEELGFEVAPLDINRSLLRELRELDPAWAFIVAHGRGGEDGTLQGLLEACGIPFAGSDSAASELCMDKVATKHALRRAGLDTPASHAFSRRAFAELGAAEALEEVVAKLGLPLVVKPVHEGSSLGLRLVEDHDALLPAIMGASAYDERILVERHVEGRELAVTVLGPADAPRMLPIIEVASTRPFYDYDAHYDFSVARLRIAEDLTDAERRLVEDAVLRAYAVCGCRDFARVDLILDADGRAQVLELNTIPGLTETGPTPYAASAAGMDFAELVAAVSGRVSGRARA
jgi:D-alanine-D-alanine ligase